MSAYGQGRLLVIDGGLAGLVHAQILKNVMLRSVRESFGETFT